MSRSATPHTLIFHFEESDMDDATRLIYLGMAIIGLGVVMATSMDGLPQPVGLVLLAVGGVVFVLGLRRRRDDGSGPR